MNSRVCDRCQESYYRSNRFRLWTVRNPGHRAGWQKVEMKVCNECFSALMVSRVFAVAHISRGRLSLVRARASG